MSDSDSDYTPTPKKAKKDKKTVKTSSKPLLICPYGAKCFRKNPDHFTEFTHPGKDGKVEKGATDASKMDTSKLEPCPFGADCYRKNLLHFAEFSHPVKGSEGPGKATRSRAKVKDYDDDTDHYDSDEGTSKGKGKGKSKGKGKKVKKTTTLKKTYSQMTETERKELMQKAMKAKEKLEKELKDTKEQMLAKDKEIDKLQNELNTGTLLVDGEKEALEGDEIKYFPLMAERAHKEGSADQVHFRLAESQFYRLLSGVQSTYRVNKVEYVVNPTLAKYFKQAQEDLKEEHGEELSYPVLAFHGTSTGNITPICENGFKVSGEKGFKDKTNTAWYGCGVYFSEYPNYSIGFIKGGTRLLLCQVLMGKVYQCDELIHGQSLKTGYNSHTSPCKKELIIFNSHHILPCYIVHYRNTTLEFKYLKPLDQRRKIADTDELMSLYLKAGKAKKSATFAGIQFKFAGELCDTHHRLGELIKKHGGVYYAPGDSVAYSYHTLVSSEEHYNDPTKDKSTYGHLATTVREEYIYDCLVKKEKLEPEDYSFD